MGKEGFNPNETHYIDAATGEAKSKTEYARAAAERRPSPDADARTADREIESSRESDPAIAGLEAEMGRVASELRDATSHLESVRKNARENAATVYSLPGESGADAAKRMADEFAAKIGPLEDRIKELRSSMAGLQAGLDAMKKARGPR